MHIAVVPRVFVSFVGGMRMAIVHLLGGLSQHAGGLETIEIEAPRVRELVIALTARFPGLDGRLDDLAVAIDGVIYNSAPYQKINVDSEVYFIPRVSGG
jgi:molybdopterin converting factor small subunit